MAAEINMTSIPTKEMALTTSSPAPLLSSTGDNLHELDPELASFLTELRGTIEQRIWPVAGGFQARLLLFPEFRHLMLEIRERIFTIACFEPRVVEIAGGPSKTITPAPSLMHVNSQSRKIALALYNPLKLRGRFTGTYINWEVDIVYLNEKTFKGAQHPTGPIRIRNRPVMAHTYTWDWTEYLDLNLRQNCQHIALTQKEFDAIKCPSFKALKSVVVIHGYGPVNGKIHKRGAVKFGPLSPSALNHEILLDEDTVAYRAWEKSNIDRYTPKLVVRDGRGRLADATAKNRHYYRRQEERDTAAIIESDEDAAIR
jgi:hypothetical protein